MKHIPNFSKVPITNLSIMAVMILMGVVLSASAYAAVDVNAYYSIRATLLNQDPDPAQPGDYVELRWKVEKSGNLPMTDVSFAIRPQYPFSLDPGDDGVRVLGDWIGFTREKEFYTLFYKLRVDPDALEGEYDLSLYAYYGSSQEKLVGDFPVRVADEERPQIVLGNIVSSPTKLVADTEEARLAVTIENIGDADAENLKATLELPEGFSPAFSYSDRAVLGTVGAGTGSTATFYIDIEESLKGTSHEAELLLEYKEEGDDDNRIRSVRLPLMLSVLDRPVFEIEEVSMTPQDPKPGDSVTINLKVRNTGSQEAESVSIRVFKESSQPFEFEEKSDFIGKLAPGSSGEAVLKLDVKNDANPKKYLLDLEIRSIVQREVLLAQKTIPFEVSQAQKASPVVGALIIAGILVIGLGGYLVVRKLRR